MWNRRDAETQSKFENALADILGSRAVRFTPQHGGMICSSFRVELENGKSIFLKTSQQPAPRLFSTEAANLKVLHEACASLPSPHKTVLRVPEVLAVSDEPAFLALEFVPESQLTDTVRTARNFGAALAALHRQNTAPHFGWPEENYIGRLPQVNKQQDNWLDFYRECRLLPQIQMAREAGVLRSQCEQVLMQVIQALPDSLANFKSTPALLHGDLWGGNYFFSGAQTVLFDPACYYGEREMEFAYCELFGGFAQEFYDSYSTEYPLDAGYEKRRPLHQLYHLLNHLNHFGGSYSDAVEAACHKALSGTQQHS